MNANFQKHYEALLKLPMMERPVVRDVHAEIAANLRTPIEWEPREVTQ